MIPSRARAFLSEKLHALWEDGRRSLMPDTPRISVGSATCGRAAGARAIWADLQEREDLPADAAIYQVGCMGACFAEPLVDVRLPGGMHYTYGMLEPKHLHLVAAAARGEPPAEHLLWTWQEPDDWGRFAPLELVASSDESLAQFMHTQEHRITARCGWIDPKSLPEALALGAYASFQNALQNQSPEDLIREVTASGLRGRGGAGFPTGIKWQRATENQDPIRYLIANADEGDPSAYMDRALLESDPHAVIEGMLLAGYATGVSQAFIFIRREYPLAVQVVQQAVDDARAAGLLGEHILGSAFSMDIRLVQSAGAFVCGEETAMIRAIEGKRGEPYPRPPYPVERGLWGHPTLVNNPETLANVPWMLKHGVEAYRSVGLLESPGTKIFCLAGDILRTGFIEVPIGINIQDLVQKIGGGVERGEPKAIQIGGPSGGILPYEPMALDYDTLTLRGAMMGSGGLVVLDSRRCLVDLSRHLSHFMASESCGKCVSCRDGMQRLVEGLEAVSRGEGCLEDLETLKELAEYIAQTSQCGLGKTAVNPFLTSLRYFRIEYEEHLQGECRSLSCKALVTFDIDPVRCVGCRCCYPNCPTHAIRGKFGKAQSVLARLCVQCRSCREYCPYKAMRVVSGKYEGEL